MINADRIVVANAALSTFMGYDFRLYVRRELRMTWKTESCPQRDFPARLRGDRSWPTHKIPSGGTASQAVAQLILYIRDMPRLPISTWKFWASEKIKLGSQETVDLLVAGGYDDPEKTCCVLCGSSEYKTGLDWWSHDGVTGPCCLYEKCVKRPKLEELRP